MKRAVLHWSGGKDAAYCLHKLKESSEFQLEKLLTTITEPFNRISMHGVRVELLQRQVNSLELPLEIIRLNEMPSMEDYEEALKNKLLVLQAEGINTSVFGDILLQDIRAYRERLLNEIHLNSSFPLWKISTQQLAEDFISEGFKVRVVCVDSRILDAGFVGLEFDLDFLHHLPKEVDPCGENGEFHTFVYDGPGFTEPVLFETGEKIYKEYELSSGEKAASGFWFCDLIPK